MKAISVTIAFACFSFCILAQKTEVDSCSGYSTAKTLYSTDVGIYFNLQGLNLTKYDWSDENVNCHMNGMITNYVKASRNRTIGLYVISGAAPLFLTGALLAPFYDVSRGPWILGTIASAAGGIYLLQNAKKQRVRVAYHMNQVSIHYRLKGL